MIIRLVYGELISHYTRQMLDSHQSNKEHLSSVATLTRWRADLSASSLTSRCCCPRMQTNTSWLLLTEATNTPELVVFIFCYRLLLITTCAVLSLTGVLNNPAWAPLATEANGRAGCFYLSACCSRCCHVHKIPDDTLERTPIHDSALSERWNSKTGAAVIRPPSTKPSALVTPARAGPRLRSNVNGIGPTPTTDRRETTAPDRNGPLSFGLRKNVELASIKSVKTQATRRVKMYEIRCQQMYLDNF